MPLHAVLMQSKQLNDVKSFVEGLGSLLTKRNKGALHRKWDKGARVCWLLSTASTKHMLGTLDPSP